ncbi:coenzyme-B sulfoethylthiotransferase subunit beta [candidate division WOR-3 bacterium]|nr:coenzyme-B sulfoethylthiotransferase subunit beta [candidate division WOR-3 bacterium]
MADKIDLYSDRGAKLKSDVDLGAISPLRNKAIKKIIHDTKRTAAVDLAGIEKSLATGKFGGKGRHVPKKAMNFDVVKNADKIVAKVADLIKVDAGDDTNVKPLNGGKQMLVQVPSARIEAGAEYVASLTCASMATIQAMIDTFDLNMFNVPEVKAAIMGQYPQTMDLAGGNVKSILEIPQKDEGLGHSLRNIMANHLAAVTKKNAMNTAALAGIYEQAGVFEMGNALGMFERNQLLGLAYQNLNANNMVYGITKANGATGTIGTVVFSTVERAIEDGVIAADKKLGAFQMYKANDVSLWNAYCAAGTLIANLVNCGAGRSPQHTSSTLLYFNDLIEKETGLPGCDWGKVQGTAVGFSFFSHSIYGGGGPGVFNGNHVVTRHSRGFAIPCVAASVSLDAGVQMFTPEMTSGLVGETFGSVEEFREPIKAVAGAV